nr:dolichol kinase EVAN-like [Malus domestica]
MAAMAFAMAGMMNGERAVVLLFISRVLFSLTISLLALSLDILTDSSTSLSQFSTRPGASSGILLGAVALPTVFISKTIQLSLAVSLHQVSIEGTLCSFQFTVIRRS